MKEAVVELVDDKVAIFWEGGVDPELEIANYLMALGVEQLAIINALRGVKDPDGWIGICSHCHRDG